MELQYLLTKTLCRDTTFCRVFERDEVKPALMQLKSRGARSWILRPWNSKGLAQQMAGTEVLVFSIQSTSHLILQSQWKEFPRRSLNNRQGREKNVSLNLKCSSINLLNLTRKKNSFAGECGSPRNPQGTPANQCFVGTDCRVKACGMSRHCFFHFSECALTNQ